MELSTLVAKLTGGKVKFLRAMGGFALAGAVMTAAAPAANAQVAFGVAIGGPRYYPPAPVYRPYGYVVPGYAGYGYAPGYWEHRRFEELRAREYWDHHRGWDHERRFYGRGGWR